MPHMKSLPLTQRNYVGLAMFWGVLLIGVLGGLVDQKWAENIYTFLSTVAMIIFVAAALIKSKFRPVKQFIATYFIHVLFCVSMGWWWLCVWWILVTIGAGVSMSNYIDATKEATESEAKV